MIVWPADNDVMALGEKIRTSNHLPRLLEAKIAIAFNDSKPFIKGRFNWGKVLKFTNVNKLWHPKDKRYDFLINLCGDAWIDILDGGQREALLDLHLNCCQVEYEPEVIEENGVKHPVKDEWGRIQYTNIIKRDDDGNPKWLKVPLDLNVFTDNVGKFGLWCADLIEFHKACEHKEAKYVS